MILTGKLIGGYIDIAFFHLRTMSEEQVKADANLADANEGLGKELSDEVSDEELENVAGGAGMRPTGKEADANGRNGGWKGLW